MAKLFQGKFLTDAKGWFEEIVYQDKREAKYNIRLPSSSFQKIDFIPFDLTPAELGIKVPQIPRIHVGTMCGGIDYPKHNYMDTGLDLAHTHGCVDDPDRWLICFRRPNYPFIRDGLMLKHEIAHVLANQDLHLCSMVQTRENFEILFDTCHGPEWQAEMEKMGLPTDKVIELTWEEIGGEI